MAPTFPPYNFHIFRFPLPKNYQGAFFFHSPSHFFTLFSLKSTKHSIPTPSPQKPFPSFLKTEATFSRTLDRSTLSLQ